MRSLKKNAILILLPVLLALSILAYWHFTTYMPQVSAIDNQVKGASAANTDITLPQPLGAEVISDSVNNEGYQTTLKAKKDFNKVYSFYISVLADKEWTAEHQNVKANSYTGSYKKGDYKLNLSIFSETDTPELQKLNSETGETENIVSIEVYKD